MKNVRQKFKDTTITALNDQITRELQASYFYQAYVSNIYIYITRELHNQLVHASLREKKNVTREYRESDFCQSFVIVKL